VLGQAEARAQSGKALTQERAALAKETSRTKRAVERYQEAFEGGRAERRALRRAHQHDSVIANGEREQGKALLATLILRVNSRSEILLTYRVDAPVVCAPNNSVELGGLEPPTSWVRSRRSPI
jgi:hypothetical protein